MDLSQKTTGFPNSPGVYLMKDAQDRIIYVGKALNLKKRVSQYLPRESGFASSSGSAGGLGGSPEVSPRSKDNRYQVKFLMSRVADIDYVVTDSEKEALLLENTLIKKHKPRYNIELKDDKTYASIKLSLKDKFPRLYVTRIIKKDGSLYFGPYSSATAARETVDFIEKYFRLRNCSDHEFTNRVRPCLQYQIHRCDAPCVGYVGEEDYRKTAEQVRLFLQGRKKDLVDALEGEMEAHAEREEFEKAANTRDLIASIRETLERQKVARHNWLDQDVIGFYREGERLTFCVLMVREGKVWESLCYHLKGRGEDEDVLSTFLEQFYAEDRYLPDEILLPGEIPAREALAQIFTERKVEKVEVLVPRRGDRSDLVALAYKNAKEGFRHRAKKGEEIREILAQLQETLGLQNFPRRMECFDISNIGGQQAVGSLVCFVEGVPFKGGYRRFRIRTVEGPNDYASMKEVLKRRLLKIGTVEAEEGAKWEKPDLLVIDGGKGQLNCVLAIMEELNVTGIDIISLAKERENETQDKVFLPGRKNPVLLGRNSGLLHLLMRLRDEAHRFAITYHRKLRAKKFLSG